MLRAFAIYYVFILNADGWSLLHAFIWIVLIFWRIYWHDVSSHVRQHHIISDSLFYTYINFKQMELRFWTESNPFHNTVSLHDAQCVALGCRKSIQDHIRNSPNQKTKLKSVWAEQSYMNNSRLKSRCVCLASLVWAKFIFCFLIWQYINAKTKTLYFTKTQY